VETHDLISGIRSGNRLAEQSHVTLRSDPRKLNDGKMTEATAASSREPCFPRRRAAAVRRGVAITYPAATCRWINARRSIASAFQWSLVDSPRRKTQAGQLRAHAAHPESGRAASAPWWRLSWQSRTQNRSPRDLARLLREI
jgi:hypothetical protein